MLLYYWCYYILLYIWNEANDSKNISWFTLIILEELKSCKNSEVCYLFDFVLCLYSNPSCDIDIEFSSNLKSWWLSYIGSSNAKHCQDEYIIHRYIHGYYFCTYFEVLHKFTNKTLALKLSPNQRRGLAETIYNI